MIFTAENTQKILAGQKTMTRRKVEPGELRRERVDSEQSEKAEWIHCPRCEVPRRLKRGEPDECASCGWLFAAGETKMALEAAKEWEAVRALLRSEGERQRLEAVLHHWLLHPDYEYQTAKGPRKASYSHLMKPAGESWEPNVHRGRDGWERFDYHEEAYWMRRKDVS